MSRFHSYLQSATAIIQSTETGKPLSYQLKKYFGSHPQMGSRDRRAVSTLCYNYYRCFHAFKEKLPPEAVILSAFICSNEPEPFLAAHAPELNPYAAQPVDAKIALLHLRPDQFFPFKKFLDAEIEAEDFIRSLLVQPDSFLRIRPGKLSAVHEALVNAEIRFTVESDTCFRITNGQPFDKYLRLDKDAVVQDFSSQKVFYWLENHPEKFSNRKLEVWDCCAASGGKSILLHDLLSIRPGLTVTDIRKNIIHNLRERFGRAGIPLRRAVVADLTGNQTFFPGDQYDLIIADVPCSGSGTWARTPEQLAWFNPEVLSNYYHKQLAITHNLIPKLKPGGYLFYITCSVFEKENKVVVRELENAGLRLIDASAICGYNGKADTMFSAVLKKE